MSETLRERLRDVKITRSGMWADAELLCQFAADGVDTACSHVEIALRYLGAWCYRNAVAAKRRADARSGS